MDLADECWELVLSKLGDQHHLDAVSLVSKRFLSISNYLVHRLTISDPAFFNISNKSFFKRFDQIKSIHIRMNWLISIDIHYFFIGIARFGFSSSVDEIRFTNLGIQMEGSWKELTSSFINLKSLRFDNCTLRGSALIAIARGIPRLEQLILSRPNLVDEVDDQVMGEIASNLKELRKVSIPDTRYVTSDTLRSMSLNCVLLEEIVCDNKCLSRDIGIALRRCPNLKAVSMYGLHVDKANFHANEFSFQNSIYYARALCSIEFRDSHLSDDLLCSIAKARLPLKKLGFYNCRNISQYGILIVVKEYRFLNSLQLSSSMYLTNQQMDNLSKYLHNLTHINLSSSNSFSSSTFFIFAEICPKLLSIVMNDTYLGHRDDEDEHGAAVWETKNTHLQFLDISYNLYMNDATLKKIGYICPSLQTLTFYWNTRSKITKEGICEFLKRCPDIRNLKMNHCKEEIIIGTSTDDSSLNIEVLEVSHSLIDDKGMEAIGNRCPRLRKLGLRGCSRVTMQGVMKVVDKCTNLTEIDLAECLNVAGLDDVQILKTRPSLRKIILTDSYSVTDDVRRLFMHHGCRLSYEALESCCEASMGPLIPRKLPKLY